jgi:electron transfer flavoprotein alpha/beta subunit
MADAAADMAAQELALSFGIDEEMLVVDSETLVPTPAVAAAALAVRLVDIRQDDRRWTRVLVGVRGGRAHD